MLAQSRSRNDLDINDQAEEEDEAEERAEEEAEAGAHADPDFDERDPDVFEPVTPEYRQGAVLENAFLPQMGVHCSAALEAGVEQRGGG